MGTRQELVDLLQFVENSGISPQIGLEISMDRAADGFRAMLDGNTSGKIVFTR
jgi:D-arabinose 1-dehydrogenase-like Zn-dependent alcohol dehydrogenase